MMGAKTQGKGSVAPGCGSTPLSRSATTCSIRPVNDAQCSGVHPHSSLRFGPPFESSHSSICGTCFWTAAQIDAATELAAGSLALEPADRRRPAAAALPSAAENEWLNEPSSFADRGRAGGNVSA